MRSTHALIPSPACGKVFSLVAGLLLGAIAVAQPPPPEPEPPQDLESRLERIESSVDALRTDLDAIRAQSRLAVQRTSITFRNNLYVRAGLSLILPRSRSFSFRTDTGLGAFVGIGQYLGRHHVVDFGLEWDLYPAASLRYRFEVHGENLTWGPVIGAKVRAVKARPWDSFLDRPEGLKTTFFFAGALVGVPVGRSLMTLEILYLYNQQTFFFTNAGLQVFFF